jgi:hypothetical protein
MIDIVTCGIQTPESVHYGLHQLLGQTVHFVVLQVQLLQRVQILESQRWQHFNAEMATERQSNKSPVQISSNSISTDTQRYFTRAKHQRFSVSPRAFTCFDLI